MVLLLTAGIMGIALYLLARLARRAGIRIKGRALALAGIFAAAIALGIPAIAPFLTPDYYVKLAALAVAAAALVTLYNAYLWRKEPETAESDETAKTTEATETAETAENDERTAGKEKRAEIARASEAAEAILDENEEIEETDEPQTLAERTRAAIGPTHFKWERPRERINAEPAEEATPAEEPTLAEEHRLAEQPAPIKKAKPVEASPEPTPVEPPAPEEIPEPAPDPLAEIDAEIALLKTLDDYLDYADAAQKQGDLTRATTAYANAVDVFVNDPYIIYLYMDLGNLLKQQARYADCINVYHAALSIPVLAENPAIAREFENNIRYLEVVQAVLRRHHAEDTPFGDIPDDIRAEIEAADQALAKKQASKDETS